MNLKKIQAMPFAPFRIFVGIDVKAQRDWLRENGTDVSEMSEQEIKEANTKSNVFMEGSYHILYAIEDITVNFNI